MTSKVLFFLLLVCTASCQQQEEDDGSYSPEKYEKPYENLVDDNASPFETTTSVNQFSSVFQQPQPVNPFPPQQSPQPPQPPQPQPNPFFQQQPPPQNIPPPPPTPPPPQPPQVPRVQAQNPFPNNPFFQRFRNSEPPPQPQIPSFQQQNPPFQPRNPPFQSQISLPQNVSPFQQQNPSFPPQQDSVFPPSVGDSPSVSQVIDGVQPVSTNYQTDDGTQRTETIDSDGNIRGQYSYIDPTGKTITVRYTAGKDGFKVEGDNIPSTALSPTEDEPQQQPQAQFNQPPPPPPPPPQIPPQQQFTLSRPRTPSQFNAIQSQFDTPRSRFRNPPPQQPFNPPPQPFNPPTPPPSDTFRPRSQFINGIFQPSFRRNTVTTPPQFSQQNEASFDFQNQNSEFKF